MKRFWTIFTALALVTGAWALNYYQTDPTRGNWSGHTFSVTIVDTDIDGSWELIAHDDTALVQLASSVRPVFSAAATGVDTVQWVMTGLDSVAGQWTRERGWVAAGEKDTTDIAYYAVEFIWLETENQKDVTVTDDGGTYHTAIDGGDIWHPTGQILFGTKDRGYLESVTYSAIVGDIQWQIRIYSDYADIRDNTDGYSVIAPAKTESAGAGSSTVTVPIDKVIDKGAAVLIWAKGDAANAAGAATLRGSRKR